MVLFRQHSTKKSVILNNYHKSQHQYNNLNSSLVNHVNNKIRNKIQNRRPRRRKNTLSKQITFFSCNSAGIKNKLFSLSKVINDLSVSVFCLQETHLSREGKIKFENSKKYQIYEKLRTTKAGGGLAIGVLNDLKPVWIGEGEENIEALSVQISVNEMNLRIVNAYGPQEYDEKFKKDQFWSHLDNEVYQSQIVGSAIMIFFDANAWLGKEFIKEDPHSQNQNGKLLKEFLMRNPDLIILNSESLCEGLITRSRVANGKTENSIIDFVIVCDKVLPFVDRLLIDEKKIYALSNYSRKGKIVHSDHNSLVTKVNLKFDHQKPIRKTIFNYREENGMYLFKKKTSHSKQFLNIFNNKKLSFKNKTRKWIKALKGTIYSCFKKVRITSQKVTPLCPNFKDREQAILNNDKQSQNKAEELLGEEEARNNVAKINMNITEMKKSKNKQSAIWKIKNKILPKIKPPLPVAKRNLAGQIITNSEELKKVYLNHFHHRLRNRPILAKYEQYKKKIENDFSETLKLTKDINFPDWTMKDLECVLNSLKTSQSQDNMGLINELFMLNNVGKELKSSLLLFMNGIKNSHEIPDCFRNVYITSIPKKKKSPLELINQRGIFLVPKLRGIFIKLVYNSIIDDIEENLSLSNIGARKQRAPRDHLFVLYSVVNEVLNSKEGVEVDLVFYDVTQAYDSLWMEHSLLDLFETGVRTNAINILHELNKTAKIQVKTPVGLTDEKEVEDVIMQGETISSIVCTTTIDKVTRDCKLPPHKYKEAVDIPKLGFVDDILDITKCGEETENMNEYTTDSMNKRKLVLSKDKCVRMHISNKKTRKENDNVHCKPVHIDEWEECKLKRGSKIILKDSYVGKTPIRTVNKHVYLGDVVTNDASNRDNVLAKASKGKGIVKDILHILSDMYLGEHYIEALKTMREAMLISVLTNNLEVSLNMTAKDFKILDDVDLLLLRGAFCVSSKSSRCLLFLELGVESVEFVIKKKRIGYLFHLLTTNVPSIAKHILDEQLRKSSKGDFINIVRKDLKEFQINMSLEEISTLSKFTFARILKTACKEACFKRLLTDRQKLSKGREIKYDKLQIQNYLKSESGLSIQMMRNIYHIRSREIYLKCNFPSNFSDKSCVSLCGLGQDSEIHIYTCNYFSNENEIICEILPFDVIFDNDVEKQIRVVNILYARLEIRKSFLPSASPESAPHDPRERRTRPQPRLGIREAKRKLAKSKHKTRGLK